jgi:hypothetical protein
MGSVQNFIDIACFFQKCLKSYNATRIMDHAEELVVVGYASFMSGIASLARANNHTQYDQQDQVSGAAN